ncbi:hypothetical protein [Thioalkalivibrio sp. ALE20]|uniref:hypothetical protein n=1 Tax=Thioalkalivibrio sp. ALE20 TaxID=545275 RepID=UPI0012EA115E|nr:hypothetical protein [Thioalkalivibrio sp. ALE20]
MSDERQIATRQNASAGPRRDSSDGCDRFRLLTPAEIESLQNDKKRGAERAAELRAMEKAGARV